MSSAPYAAISHRRAVGVVAALSTAAFAYVTTEVMPVGLLTLISDDLHVSRSATGLLVTGYALVVVLASVPLTRLTRRVPRRRLLGSALVVFVLGTAASALAPGYEALLGARLVTALSQAVFWSVVASTATGLFPPEVRGRMVARLSIGTALGPVLGVPFGTWLGQQAGWRTAFAVMAAVSLMACVTVTALVPSVPPEQGGAAVGTAPDRRRYRLLALATLLAVTGAMGTFTYITPFLLDVSAFAPSALTVLLLVSGVSGVVGTLVVGRFLDRFPWAVLVVLLALMTGALLGLYLLGAERVAAVALLAVVGLTFSALAAAIQSRTLQVAPAGTDMASATISSAFNLGTATGSLFGAALIATGTVRTVPLVGGLLVASALAVVLSERRLPAPARRQPSRRRDAIPVATV